MKWYRLWIVGLMCVSTAYAIAKDSIFLIDLEDSQRLHYGSKPNSAVQGDLDNDGVMDVAVGTSLSAFTYPGKCFILWGGTEYQELLEYSGDFTVVAIEDINNDGLKDILCTNIIFINQGNREFVADPYKGFPLTAKSADLNGDGILDSVTGSSWRDGSDGTSHGFDIRSDYFEIVDVNNDGKLDVIGYQNKNHLFFWYRNTGDVQLFGGAELITEKDIVPCGVVDIDHDGDDEILVINDGVTGFLQNNTGLLPIDFVPLFVTTPMGFTSDIGNIIIDIDYDNDWDLFGYNYDEERFFVVEQVGYRTLQFEFHWISDNVSLEYWHGYFVYQNADKNYYYFDYSSTIGSTSTGGLYRTPINVQAENAVSCNWELLQ